jgi:ABC-2 type transport system ATP-binding protein
LSAAAGKASVPREPLRTAAAGAPPGAAIEVEALAKTYVTPFLRRRVHALRGVSFTVRPGEVFGFLGPNGAGKTTTIRCLMGLIRASAGTAKILGKPVPSRVARSRVGFLPEHPYFYDYLTVEELLDLSGRLFGLDSKTRRERAGALIEKVGLDRARGQSLKRFSKGMLQRAGLAQALINDPDLVVLDEPTSGLDPIGRKEVRDLIVELKELGKTVFFSSHILTDIETISDRVAIVIRGKIQEVGAPRELAGKVLLGVDVTLRIDDVRGAAADEIAARGDGVRRGDHELTVTLAADADVDEVLGFARERGAKVIAVTPRHDTLEDLFMRHAMASEGGRAAGAQVEG